ncbi:MAG: ABC transporter permease [Paracoccaceae bacterium]|nr:ABC transporter permease [Paracoccaceae bacterium]
MRLEVRETYSPALSIIAPFGAIIFSLLCSFVLLFIAGAPPIESFFYLIKGAFGSPNALAETGARATPLILTGLAAGIAFRAKFWNIGAEGQLYAGALAATFFGTGLINLPQFLMIPFLFLVGGLAGALVILPLVILRQLYKVDEVVTTLLMNFVILLFVSYLLEGPMKDPMSLGWPQGSSVIDNGVLPQILERTRLHLGFLIAIVVAICLWVILSRTAFGFRIKSVGHNPAATYHAGIPLFKTVLVVACLSGALAGFAGITETAGLKGYLTLDLSPGFGYTGIAVAMLAALNPIGIIFSALFLAMIYVGADSMSRAVNVPTYLADVVVAITVLSVLVSLILINYKIQIGKLKF